MTTIELSTETEDLLKVIREMRPWFTKLSYDELIFEVLIDWFRYDGKETVEEWMKEMF